MHGPPPVFSIPGGDFSNNGWLSRTGERVLQHYRSGLNSIPTTEARPRTATPPLII